MEKPLEHVVIVGCGLLGASLGMAMRKQGLARVVTGVGRAGSPSVEVARQRGAIDRATHDAGLAVSGRAVAGGGAVVPADLVVLCAPVRQFPEAFKAIASELRAGALVTDVGSTKVDVQKWAEEFLPKGSLFVGSHPMAGSEKNGPEAAREDLYKGAACMICPPAVVTPELEKAVERITALWRALGMRMSTCSPERHDWWVALISHLPHALSATLVNTAVEADAEALKVVGTGFLDTSRLASGDVSMWVDIFLTNPEPVVKALDAFIGNFSRVREAVAKRDEAGLRRALSGARESREKLLAERKAAGLTTGEAKAVGK